MLWLVRGLLVFGVSIATSLSMSFRDAQAQAPGCTVALGQGGAVRAGESLSVQANCSGIDPAKTEFIWKVEAIDNVGNRRTMYQSKGVIGRSRIKLRYTDPATYEVTLRYSTDGRTWNEAPTLPLTVAPAAPPVAGAKPPAPPPAKVADQVRFNPSSFQLRTNERAMATAMKPQASNLHIRWTLGTNTVQDKWTVAFGPIKNPGNYTLNAVVWNGSNPSDTKSYALPITVSAAGLSVSVQGPKQVQQNSRQVVYIIPNNGVPPYHVTISGVRSGSIDFKTKAWFLAPADTLGDKTLTIAVNDAKGATFSKTVTFNVVGAAAPAPIGVKPYVGSYIATLTGPKPPVTNIYWAHLVGIEPQGYVISVYALGTNLHFVLNPNTGNFTMEGGDGSKAAGTGSIAGNGAVGTIITMQWTATGSDGKPTPFAWKLKKYDDHDFASPQQKAPDGTAFAR